MCVCVPTSSRGAQGEAAVRQCLGAGQGGVRLRLDNLPARQKRALRKMLSTFGCRDLFEHTHERHCARDDVLHVASPTYTIATWSGRPPATSSHIRRKDSRWSCDTPVRMHEPRMWACATLGYTIPSDPAPRCYARDRMISLAPDGRRGPWATRPACAFWSQSVLATSATATLLQLVHPLVRDEKCMAKPAPQTHNGPTWPQSCRRPFVSQCIYAPSQSHGPDEIQEQLLKPTPLDGRSLGK